MCPHHGKDKINDVKPQDMDFKLYKKIIDEGAENNLRAIKLNYGGEPLLYPKLVNAIKYAKKNGIIDIQLNTNGTFLNNGMVKSLIRSGLDLIILSDYGQKDLIENLVYLVQYKKILKSKKPLIRLKTDNFIEWKHLMPEDVEVIEPKYYDYARVEQDFVPSNFKCSQPWQRFLILADGTICSCSCGIVIPNKILGNVNRFTIKELWNGASMKFLRYCHEFKESHFIEQCRMCPVRKEYIKQELK